LSGVVKTEILLSHLLVGDGLFPSPSSIIFSAFFAGLLVIFAAVL
jgi:hypothetical protein